MDSAAVDCDPVRMSDPASRRSFAASLDWFGDHRFARRQRNHTVHLDLLDLPRGPGAGGGALVDLGAEGLLELLHDAVGA